MTHILTAVLGLLRTAGEEPPVSRLVLLWSLGLWHHQHSWIFLKSSFPICHFPHISPAPPFLRENKSHQKETLVMTRHKNFKCLWKVLSVAKDYKTQLSWLNQEDNFISSHINKGCRRASKLGVSVAPWCQGPGDFPHSLLWWPQPQAPVTPGSTSLLTTLWAPGNTSKPCNKLPSGLLA